MNRYSKRELMLIVLNEECDKYNKKKNTKEDNKNDKSNNNTKKENNYNKVNKW